MSLKDELTNDPIGRGYSTMTVEQIAASLNVADRQRVRASTSGDELFGQTVAAEFAALSAAKQQMWISFCARDSIDPRRAANIAFVQFIFGGGSTTVANLASARMETISRADELDLGLIDVGTITGTVQEVFG